MRLAVLASGTGTNFKAIAQACQSGDLNAKCSLLITNRHCGAIDIASQLDVSAEVLQPNNYNNYNLWDHEVSELLQNHNINLVILAGFLKKIGPKVLHNFSGKILNIHPALLPKYGGAGMYGENVHRAVIQAGEKVSGSSVHWVTENFDEGPIVNQFTVTVEDDETPESLSLKVRSKEPAFYVETIKQVLSGLK